MGYLSVTCITSLILYFTYYNIALVEAKDVSLPSVSAPDNNLQKISSMWLKAMPVRRFFKPAYPGEFNVKFIMKCQILILLLHKKLLTALPYRKENIPPPVEMELFEDSANDFDKRTFDDYGHMRFGKRGDDSGFDDYGHMRFGKR